MMGVTFWQKFRSLFFLSLNFSLGTYSTVSAVSAKGVCITIVYKEGKTSITRNSGSSVSNDNVLKNFHACHW